MQERARVTAPHTSPLSGPPPAEVPLTNAPLVRVIAQVRFPLIASIEKRDFIGAFQEAIRATYPVLHAEQSRNLVLSPDRPMETRATTIWRFHDPATQWRVTLAPDFVALETERYSSRQDLLSRLSRVLHALEDHINPRFTERLGVRYIDRITGPNLSQLPSLVRQEVSGILASPLRQGVVHALSQSVFTLPDEEPALLSARWGLLARGSTMDPTIAAIDEASWILDLDAYEQLQGAPREFDVEATITRATRFSERIYSVFRWAVNDEFLRRFGGAP
ncbi:MAG: TIGR04255 family protein [Nannocystis sp.]|nr:TIGR04255 family protein [Nannocystis sp.]